MRCWRTSASSRRFASRRSTTGAKRSTASPASRAASSEEEAFVPRIVCMGEVLMDLFAEPGRPLAAAECLRPTPGGAPANVAIALARLGADVGFIGRVGADEFGTHLRKLLRSEGIDVSQLAEDPVASTMLALIWSPSPTEQHFTLYHGASAFMRPESLSREYVESAEVFVHTSIVLASPSREADLQAARWARAAGRQVVFDVNLRPTLWPDLEVARATIWEAVALASVVKLNQRELAFMTDTFNLDRGVAQVLQRGPGLCCVSLGDDGSYFNTGANRGRV